MACVACAGSKQACERADYDGRERYGRENDRTSATPQDLRSVVVASRTAKLPDPKLVANNGSFFANPIVSDEVLVQILAVNSGAKYWHLDGTDKVKLSAAWLVEQAGFKAYHDTETGMATWPQHSLVLVNEHAKSTFDVLTFKTKIVATVKEKFGVILEQEPELLL